MQRLVRSVCRRSIRQVIGKTKKSALSNVIHFHISACHPCAGAMLIFSVSIQFQRMIPEGNPGGLQFVLSAPVLRVGLAFWGHSQGGSAKFPSRNATPSLDSSAFCTSKLLVEKQTTHVFLTRLFGSIDIC